MFPINTYLMLSHGFLIHLSINTVNRQGKVTLLYLALRSMLKNSLCTPLILPPALRSSYAIHAFNNQIRFHNSCKVPLFKRIHLIIHFFSINNHTINFPLHLHIFLNYLLKYKQKSYIVMCSVLFLTHI